MGCPSATSSRQWRQGLPPPSETMRSGDCPLASAVPPRQARARAVSRATKRRLLDWAGIGRAPVGCSAGTLAERPPVRTPLLAAQSAGAEEAAGGDAVEDELHGQRRQQ